MEFHDSSHDSGNPPVCADFRCGQRGHDEDEHKHQRATKTHGIDAKSHGHACAEDHKQRCVSFRVCIGFGERLVQLQEDKECDNRSPTKSEFFQHVLVADSG